MKTKNVEMINDETEDLIKVFSLKGKYRLIGSQSLRAIQYGSDYDIQVDKSNTTPSAVAKLFQEAYEKAKKNPDYWITDFKAGWDERLVYRGDYSKDSIEDYLKKNANLIPKKRADAIRKATGEEEVKLIRDIYILRWKPADIKRGWVKMIDGKKKYLKDAVLDKTTLKIDLLGLVGNQFVEVSENYIIKTKNGKTNEVPETREEVEEDYEEEIQYYARKDSFKALKRLFSLLRLDDEKKNKKALDKLVAFFNSQVGYLNKIRNELNILEQVLTQDFRKPKWEDIQANLQFIKEQISNIYSIPLDNKVFKDIDNMTPKSVLGGVVDLKNYFTEVINNQSKGFLMEML